jgi:hypothetical protein
MLLQIQESVVVVAAVAHDTAVVLKDLWKDMAYAGVVHCGDAVDAMEVVV